MNNIVPLSPLVPPPLDAPSVLLLGPAGAGKTTSLVTLLQAGLKLFVISTEPNGLESLLDACAVRKVPLTNLHWRVIRPARQSIENLLEMAKKVTVLNHEGLAKMGPTFRSDAQYIQFLETCKEFRCQRDGKSYGSVFGFGPDCALAIDSMTGLNLMAWDLTVGLKVTAHPGEWGTAMNTLHHLLTGLTSNLRCLFVLTAHIEREKDEMTGGTKLMVSTLGSKLAPKIPPLFSEVVLASSEAGVFHWNTVAPNIDLKHRALPLQSKLLPTFEPVVAAYKKRLEMIRSSST